MSYQMFRVVDGKIIEEDEATFQEREKKMLEGILMPVSYTCLLCNKTLCPTTNKSGLYKHWKTFHCGENDDPTEDENSETEETGDEFLPEPSMIQNDEGVEFGKEDEESSCEKTISAKVKTMEWEHEDQEVEDSNYYPKDIFIYKINVIHQNMDFEISPPPHKELPPERCYMDELKNNLPLSEEIIKDSYDCVENLQNQRNLDFSALEISDSPESEDWGPMPELSPQCSPSYDKQLTDNSDDANAEMTEGRGDPEKLKRKHSNFPDNDTDGGRPKRRTKKAKASGRMTRANLYDAMRQGERLWWCKLCDDYLKSVELLKYHIAKVHNEDMSKINRFNIATWDLEIARTFTSPYEIELEYELDLLVPANPIKQVPS